MLELHRRLELLDLMLEDLRRECSALALVDPGMVCSDLVGLAQEDPELVVPDLGQRLVEMRLLVRQAVHLPVAEVLVLRQRRL